MTQLLDRPVAESATLYPRHPLSSPGVRAAEDFYLRGSDPSFRQIRIQVSGPDGGLRRTWLAHHMEGELNTLLLLEPGWDGERGQPLTDAAVDATVELLFAVASDLSLPPQVFPLADGGLQMEWHAGGSVEIEIDSAGCSHALIADEDNEILLNTELTSDDTEALEQVRHTIEGFGIRLARAR